ncbi:MAG TPA: porin family protein [Aquaticitalea sp.]|nr:porin family protein [Aquaticitalea sp.]HNU59847.1 porin family protein [Aquaticitalea sp.]
MKKISTFILFLFLAQLSSAQLFTKEKIINDANGGKGSTEKNLLNWGYFFGLNSYDFKFEYEEDKPDILVEDNIGFNVGLVGDLRINDHFNLRFEPGLYITQRNIQYDSIYFTGINFTDADLKREVKSTYIHLPLLLKISTKRINNFKPFIVGGFSTALNLSSNEKNPDDNSSGQFRSKKNMMFYELGFGIDFYLFYFKFTPSIRGVFALNDEIVRDVDPNSPWTSNVSSMKTRGVFINFTFQ